MQCVFTNGSCESPKIIPSQGTFLLLLVIQILFIIKIGMCQSSGRGKECLNSKTAKKRYIFYQLVNNVLVYAMV